MVFGAPWSGFLRIPFGVLLPVESALPTVCHGFVVNSVVAFVELGVALTDGSTVAVTFWSVDGGVLLDGGDTDLALR